MHVADSSIKAPGGFRRLPVGLLKEKTMELEELISILQTILYEADVALDGGDRNEARKQLRKAKQMLDDELAED